MSPALRLETQHPAVEDLTEAERRQLPAGEFFLYPANLWPHKNHRRVLQAFDQFLQRTQRRIEFLFTGHPAGWDQVAAGFTHLPIRHLGYVRRTFLQLLLQRARALVFFSLFEGFGMPVLEAFHAGAPVICSNTTSLPEIGGDAVLSCDPCDTVAMSNLMIRVLEDEGLRKVLRARGRERLPLYSWRQSALHLLEACERVAKTTPPTSAAGEGVTPDAAAVSSRGWGAELGTRLTISQRLLADIDKVDKDRAARLEAILRGDALLKEMEKNQIAQREAIARLQERLRKLQSNRLLVLSQYLRSVKSAPRKAMNLVKRLSGRFRRQQSARRAG